MPATTKALDYKLEEIRVKNATFVQAVSELSQKPVPNLHLGLEEVLREQIMDNASPGPTFSLLMHEARVRDILDALCSHDNRYIWTEDGATINIYPRAVAGDGKYFLNRRLDEIAVKDIPDPGEGLTFLHRQLPAEQLGYAGAGGHSHYPAPWTQAFRDITVRQFINRLTEQMGVHTSWVLSGAREERYFTFLKGGFH